MSERGATLEQEIEAARKILNNPAASAQSKEIAKRFLRQHGR